MTAEIHEASIGIHGIPSPTWHTPNRRSRVSDRAPNDATERRPSHSRYQRRSAPRVCSRPASTLGVGQYAARSKPAVWDTYPGALDVPAKVGQLQRTSQW